MISTAHGGVVAGYRPEGTDEMLAADGAVRPGWAPVAAALAGMDLRDVRQARADAARMLADEGVTYHVPGTGERRPWQLDPLPLVLDAEGWAAVERGVVQRAELLNLVLADLYGPQRLLADGLLPSRLVHAHPGFLRPLQGVRVPGAHQLFTYAVDLVRDADGRVVVMADRTQAPSGAAYALQNRVVSSRVLPRLHRACQVQRLAPYFRALRAGLQAVAPEGVTLPRTVLLTPGARNETAVEHALLAARLGVSLVEGSDLVVRHGRVWLRSLGHLEPVDVVLRRLDQEWCDPLELRPDSLIGVPGLVQAVRSGRCTVVNALGGGVLESPALLPFLPAIAQRLLGQPLRLPAVETWWLTEEAVRRSALADPAPWVFKRAWPGGPATVAPEAGGRLGGVVVGSALDDRGVRALRAAVEGDPAGWVVQARLRPATAPALADEGVVPRRVVLRAFAVADGSGYAVLPGGLTRVAPDDDAIVIANRTGAPTKDTWVLAGQPELLTGFWLDAGDGADAVPAAEPPLPASGMPSRAAEQLFWLGRYAERAEGVTRLLREVDDRRTELAGLAAQGGAGQAAGTACVRALLQALTQVTTTYPGFVGEGAAARLDAPDAELDRVAGADEVPGTLAHAVRHLLDCVDAVRDQLSGDTWLVVTDLQRLVVLADQGGRVPGGGPREAHAGSAQGDWARVLHGLLAIQGLGAENMVRDVGWRFMDAGRRLERSLQLLALLRATATHVRDAPADSLVLESVLRVAESIITYRRRYRSRARVTTLLDLLLLDGDNPRSLAYQLELLAADLAELPGGRGAGRLGPADRAVLEASTALRVADTAALAADDGAVRPELDALLGHLHGLLAEAGRAVEGSFAHPLPQRPLLVDTTGRPDDAVRTAAGPT